MQIFYLQNPFPFSELDLTSSEFYSCLIQLLLKDSFQLNKCKCNSYIGDVDL